jgi:flagellar hook-associated protein 2
LFKKTDIIGKEKNDIGGMNMSNTISPNRVTGLSGFDTESMVQQLMKVERMPLDKLKGKQQVLRWKQDLYREINTKLAAVRDAADGMRFSGQWSLFKVNSSNSQAVSATTASGTKAGNHTVQVTQLADKATLVGNTTALQNKLEGTALNLSTSPISVSTGNQSMVVQLDGVQKTITLTNKTYDGNSGATLQDLANDINTQLTSAFGDGKILVGVNGGKLSLTPMTSTSDLKVMQSGTDTLLGSLGFTNNQSYLAVTSTTTIGDLKSKLGFTSASFTLNGITFSSTSDTQTLQDFMNTVNNSAAGVKMSYDSYSNKITFVSKSTGQNAKVDFTGTTDPTFLNKMGIGFSGTLPATVTGKDSTFTIDGVSMSRADNTATVDGISYTFNQVTGSPVTVTSQQDTDALFNKIKDFVDKYNDMVAAVNGKLTEKTTYYKYPPLTDDQKKDMKDQEITLWEASAKGGLLHGDSILSSAVTSARLNLSNKVQYATPDGSSPTVLSEIGITTSINYRDNGKLIIDEQKLRDALAANPNGVINLFTAKSSTVNKTDPNYTNQSGFAVRMYDQMSQAVTNVQLKIDNKGYDTSTNYSLDKEIKGYDKEISDLEERLTEKENSYYQRFAAVESALSQSNAQGNWLAAQLGGARQ